MTGARIRFARILCAVDFSPDSVEAFRLAVEMARLSSGELLVFHVVEPQPSLSPDALIEINKEAINAMAELIASARAALEGIEVHAELAHGAAFVEIAERARGWPANLVVLGAKGGTALEEIVVGGTAEAVVKESPCSVLVVRSD
jgi:nucleotide-binding universal stress UspA family protein